MVCEFIHVQKKEHHFSLVHTIRRIQYSNIHKQQQNIEKFEDLEDVFKKTKKNTKTLNFFVSTCMPIFPKLARNHQK